jgi:hypothetical protein
METPMPQAGQVQGYAMQGAGAVNDAPVSGETKRKIFYTIIAFILLSLCGAVGHWVDIAAITFYWGFSFVFLALGILHLFLIDWLKLFGTDKAFARRVLFSIIIVLLSMIGYFLAFYFLGHKSGYALYFTLSLWYFMVPMAVVRCFDLALGVPAKEYKEWYYPSKPIIADMDRIDLSNFAIITYVFSKKYGDKEMSNFQSKAPYDLKLGDLFYFFIQEWNYKYPQANIEFADSNKNVFGWLFYVQDKWYQPKRFLDPDITIRENKILVNQIIQTLRVPQPNPETKE